MNIRLAAQRKVCSPCGSFTARATLLVAAVFVFSAPTPAARGEDARADATVLFSACVDLISGKEILIDHSSSEQQPAAAAPQPAVIERIEFIDNRRVRSDPLHARIFSHKGNAYKEETLRRDFQALWKHAIFRGREAARRVCIGQTQRQDRYF